jgi:hypothetical protein
MVERREHLRLTLEPREAFRVGRENFGEDFQRDVAIELRVARAIDLAHPTAPKRGEELEDTETIAGH